jgi:hypothetical protein
MKSFLAARATLSLHGFFSGGITPKPETRIL